MQGGAGVDAGMNVTVIECKDCLARFFYSEEARQRDLRRGGTPPERCSTCRPLHRREFQRIGLSHVDIVKLREHGSGGLGTFRRPPRERTPLVLAPPTIPKFPIEPIAAKLVADILGESAARVHVVVGPTGSGKSTWLPLRLLREDEIVRHGPIFVTEPRIPATEGPARFVGKMLHGAPADSHDDRWLAGPGLAVGYRHSQVGETCTDHANRLVYMTDGTLLGMIGRGELARASVVMIDEAHESTTNIQLILGLLRDRLYQYPRLHVIVASATVDAESFVAFFESGGHAVELYRGTGFTYPILDLYADDAVAHLSQPAVEHVPWQVIDESEARDRLIEPSPCWVAGDAPPKEPYPLRYYPQFEALVATGDAGLDLALRYALKTAEWARARAELRACIEVERFEWPKSQTSDALKGAKALTALTDWAADTVISIAEREIVEASRRRERWKRRAELGWPDLVEPRRRGHILVFLPTNAAIDDCAKALEDALRTHVARYPSETDKNVVCPFSRARDEADRDEVSRDWPLSDDRRKVVLGTNLAETSLTLDGLVHVVDTGLISEEIYDLRQGKRVPTVPHSQAGRRQRVGRVGRKEPGESRRLYTRAELRVARAFTRPQIERSSGVDALLSLASAGVPVSTFEEADKSIGGVSLLSLPPVEVMRQALANARSDGALTAEGDLTPLGSELRSLNVEPFTWRRLLVDADRLGLLWEVATFLAFAKLPDVRGSSGKRRWLYSPSNHEDDEDGNDESDAQDPETTDPLARYREADLAIRHRALRAGMKDDLALYLMLWQGWFRRPVAERATWAASYGLSHAALKWVTRTLGVDPGTVRDECGWLPHFYAFDQKGVMSRDVQFDRLDQVRHLLALYLPECEVPNGPRKLARGCVEIGDRERMLAFGGNEKGGYAHLVWIDARWPTDDRVPRDPVTIARVFAANHGRRRIVQAPFATAEKLTRLPPPSEGVPIPAAADVAAWLLRRATEIDARSLVRVTITHDEHARMAFARLDDGALVPIEHMQPGASRGQRWSARLDRYPKQHPTHIAAILLERVT